jgi:hypothetical protein
VAAVVADFVAEKASRDADTWWLLIAWHRDIVDCRFAIVDSSVIGDW